MKRSSRVAASVLGLMAALFAVALRADERAKKTDAAKPPWQRMLQGEDAKKAAEQEKKLAQLQQAGQFTEALKVAEALAELRTKTQGVDHWQAVDARFEVEAIRYVLKANKQEQQSYRRAFALEHEAEALTAKGRYQEAQPLLEQVLAIRRKVLGAERPETASCTNNMAGNLEELYKLREAEDLYRRALDIFRKTLGEEHPNTATSYNNVASNLDNQGLHQEAEKFYRDALRIRLNVLGEDHLDTAIVYNNLGYNLHEQGKYKQAEAEHQKALAIRRKQLGEKHLETATSYNNIAIAQSARSEFAEAEKNTLKALTIRRSLLGEEHADMASSYNTIAFNLASQGKFSQAEVYYRKALAIRLKVLGEDDVDTANSFNNLATNQVIQGKFAEADKSLRRALSIRLRLLGENHPDTALSYNNVAYNLHSQGKYEEAEEGYRKALAVCLKVLGEDHPETALCYNNVAHNLQFQKKYDKAEEVHRKALAIRCKVLGEKHPLTAVSYNNVSGSLASQGKHQEAEEGFRKALAIHSEVLGGEHPHTVLSYNNLAGNQSAQGKYAEAEKLWRSAAEGYAKARMQIAATGLERAAYASLRSPLPFLAAVLARNGKATEAWQRFEESLARGAWDDLTARLRRSQAERAKQDQITVHIDQLQTLIMRVNGAKATPERTKQREQLLGQLRKAYDELTAYTQQLEEKYGPDAGQVFPRSQIQAALPPDTALLGWLDIAGQPKAVDSNGEHWAVLLRSTDDPVWVRLTGSGTENAWTQEDARLPQQLRAALQSHTSKWQPIAERLRQQRLQPLVQHLKGVRHLIVLPSTDLAGVPVEVLADGYTVSYAHSGTMDAYLRQRPAPTGKGLLALADPIFEAQGLSDNPQPLPPGGVLLTMVAPGSNAFRAGLKRDDVLLRYGETELSGPADFKPLPEGADSDKNVPVIVWRDGETRKQPLYVRPGKLGVVFAPEPAPQALAEQRRLDRLLASRSGDDSKWVRLPGARLEVAALQRLIGSEPTRVLLDSEASEQQLDELARTGELGKYRYIHLATHGEVNDVFPLRSAVILARDRLPDDKQRTDLLVSGKPIPDGRLTAEEVLRRWNLNCDLVTLSACETALGKYERGEGFVGFAQALVLSGSRSVCLSLWKVNDTATTLLMERFYQNLLGKREGLDKPMTKADALAEAKVWLRNLPRGEAVKRAASLSSGTDRGKHSETARLEIPAEAVPVAAAKGDRPYAHPYYWAAFVLVGNAD